MYITGRNTDGYGTIFPSIIEFQRNNNLKNLEVIFVGKNFNNSMSSKKKVLKAIKISGLKLKVKFYPDKKRYGSYGSACRHS